MVVIASVAALAAVALVLAASSNRPAKRTSKYILTSASTFSISGSIYASPACSGAAALLYPNVARCEVFTAHNSLTVPIKVVSITTTLDTTNFPAPPAQCMSQYLTLPTFSGSFSVPAGGNAASPGVPIELKDSGTDQSACEGLTYHLVFSAKAQYNETYSTSTVIASSANPSPAGTTVTYTVTVTASATSSQDPVPSSPTGTVVFKDGSTPISCATAPTLTSTSTTTSTATCSVTYSSTSGSPHSITATYNPTAVTTDPDYGNFTGSASSSVSETIQSGGNMTIGSGATVTVANGQTTTGNFTVANGGTLNLSGGTVSGNVTLSSGATLSGTGGTISGNVTSAGSVTLTNTTVTGNLQTTAGPVTLGHGAVVSGSLQVNGGGPVNLNGVSLGTSGVDVGNQLQVQGLTTTAASSICATSTKGNLVWTSNASPVVIGGTSCAGNSIGGNLQVQTNTGKVTVSGNTVAGNLQVQNNTGGGSVTGNTAHGKCQISGDKPGVTGSTNTPTTCNTGSQGA